MDPVGNPVATTLMQAQYKLCEMAATNKARKAPPPAIVKDKLGYQEYFGSR
jgi:hypothetical protein